MELFENSKKLSKEIRGNMKDMVNIENGEEGKVLTGVTKLAGQGVEAYGATLQDVGNLAGDGVKLAGNVVGGVGNFAGDVLNAPGNIVQGAGDLLSKGSEAVTNTLGDGVGAIAGEGAGKIVKGAGQIVSGAVKGVGDLAGGVLKIPGNILKGAGDLVKGVGHFGGSIVKGVGQIAGGILRAPGAIIKGIAQGIENIAYGPKEKTAEVEKMSDKVVKAPITINNRPATKEQLEKLAAGKPMLDGHALDKLDKMTENISKAVNNGEITRNAPFAHVLTMPKEQRAEAVKTLGIEMRDNLVKLDGMLKNSPDQIKLPAVQKEELKLFMKGVEMHGGPDKFVQNTFGLKPEDLKKDVTKDNNLNKDNSQNKETKTLNIGGNDKSNAVNAPLKTNDVKDIKPVMSGPTAAPTAPTQNLNVGGRV